MHILQLDSDGLRIFKLIHAQVIVQGIVCPKTPLIDLHLRKIDIPSVYGDMTETHIIALRRLLLFPGRHDRKRNVPVQRFQIKGSQNCKSGHKEKIYSEYHRQVLQDPLQLFSPVSQFTFPVCLFAFPVRLLAFPVRLLVVPVRLLLQITLPLSASVQKSERLLPSADSRTSFSSIII